MKSTASIPFVISAASARRRRGRGTACGSTFRSLGMLIGLSAGEFLGDAEHLRGEALEALRQEGASLGANAIVRVEFEVSEGSDGSCLVEVSGDAVLVERRPSSQACPA